MKISLRLFLISALHGGSDSTNSSSSHIMLLLLCSTYTAYRLETFGLVCLIRYLHRTRATNDGMAMNDDLDSMLDVF